MVDKVNSEKEVITDENEELKKEKILANVKIREQQEEIFKFKNEVIKLTQESDNFKQDMNTNNDVTFKKMVSHVGEQNKAATISKNVSTMKIVHTNDFFEKIMEVFNKCGLDE